MHTHRRRFLTHAYSTRFASGGGGGCTGLIRCTGTAACSGRCRGGRTGRSGRGGGAATGFGLFHAVQHHTTSIGQSIKVRSGAVYGCYLLNLNSSFVSGGNCLIFSLVASRVRSSFARLPQPYIQSQTEAAALTHNTQTHKSGGGDALMAMPLAVHMHTFDFESDICRSPLQTKRFDVIRGAKCKGSCRVTRVAFLRVGSRHCLRKGKASIMTAAAADAKSPKAVQSSLFTETTRYVHTWRWLSRCCIADRRCGRCGGLDLERRFKQAVALINRVDEKKFSTIIKRLLSKMGEKV